MKGVIKMKKILLIAITIAIVAAMAFAGTACAQQQAGETTAAATEAAEAGETTAAVTEASEEVVAASDQLYVEVSALNSLEYFFDHKLGMEQVGIDLGVTTEYTGPADYDMNAVIAAMEQAVAKKAKGIVLVGWEESLNGAIQSAQASGVPVVCVDADLPNSGRVAFVGTSNFDAGVQIGTWMKEQLGGKGKIATIGMPTLSNIQARLRGIESVFEGTDIQIVEYGDSKTDAVGSAQTARDILTKYPDLNALMGIDSHSGLGIGTAIKEANMVGKVLGTGWDRDNSLLQLIDEGVVTATVVQRTALMPYYATLILWQMANSQVYLTKSIDDDITNKVLNIPTNIDTGIFIVTKEQATMFQR